MRAIASRSQPGLVCALLFAASAAAALACIGAGEVGFGGTRVEDAWFFARSLKWWLLGCVAGGAAVGWASSSFHRAWLEKAPVPDGKLAALSLVGIPRMFVHAPFFGGLTLLRLTWALGRHAVQWLRWKLGRPGAAEPDGQVWGPGLLATFPFWVMVGPMSGFAWKSKGGARLVFPPPDQMVASALRWLPGALVFLAFFTQLAEEETGDPIDPRVLLALGTYWLGDLLALWFLAKK